MHHRHYFIQPPRGLKSANSNHRVQEQKFQGKDVIHVHLRPFEKPPPTVERVILILLELGEGSALFFFFSGEIKSQKSHCDIQKI